MKTLKYFLVALALAGLSTSGGAQPAAAQEHWHGGDMHHFHDRDIHIWHGGQWFHGTHGGRLGWWWIVGDSWYFYPAPVYPYPDPYVPPVVVVPAQPEPPPFPAPPPAANYWYYCPNPPGYYPYVPNCPTNWTPVPAQPG